MITEQSQSSIFRTEGWSRRLLVNNLRYCRMLRCSANLCKSLQALGCQDKATNTQKSSKNKTSETPLFHDSLLMHPAFLSKKGCPKTFCLDVIQSFQSNLFQPFSEHGPNMCSKCQWYILRPCRGSFGISFLSAVRFVPTSLGASATSAAPSWGVHGVVSRQVT
jgi:hypothetical protein